MEQPYFIKALTQAFTTSPYARKKLDLAKRFYASNGGAGGKYAEADRRDPKIVNVPKKQG